MDFVTTVGASNATSYVTLSAAATYFSTRPNIGTAWTSASSATRQALLIHATAIVDTLPFISKKVETYQGLQFPRACQKNVAAIPEDIRRAVLEEALALLRKKEPVERTPGARLHSSLAHNLVTCWLVKRADFGR